MSRYRFIAAERGHYPVRRLYQVLGVPASGFYAWQAAQQRAVGRPKTPAWETVLVKVFGRHHRRDGTRRLQVALREKGHRVGRQRLRTAMRRRGLHALQPKAYTPAHDRFDAWLALRPQPAAGPAQTHPGQPRVGIGYHVFTARHGLLGLFVRLPGRGQQARRGLARAATMPEELVTTALGRAFLAQPPTPQLVVHSDRGGQYGGKAYRKLLHDHQALRSQSRRGDCYDNAQAENRLKVLDAAGPGSKRRCSNYASGPFLPTWPTRRPASPIILTTTTTTGCTPVLAIRYPITLIINFFKLLP